RCAWVAAINSSDKAEVAELVLYMGGLRSILRGFSGQREGSPSNRNAIRAIRALKPRLGEGSVLIVPPRRAGSSFLPVLHLPFLDGLPLHVARRVRPARAERHDMVHDVPGSTVRIPGTPQEIIPGLATPWNPPTRIGRFVRVRACRRCAVVSCARRPVSLRSCIGATPRRRVASWSW